MVMSKKFIDLTGLRVFRLLVLGRSYVPRKGHGPFWNCVCDCGKHVVAIGQNLRSGKHRSCGCYRGGPTGNRHKPKTVSNGYVFVIQREHPRANKTSGRVREHILVMEAKLGRALLPKEEVHHKNAVRSDNRPENLELWTRSQPSGARVTDSIAWAISILETYAPDKLASTQAVISST